MFRESGAQEFEGFEAEAASISDYSAPLNSGLKSVLNSKDDSDSPMRDRSVPEPADASGSAAPPTGIYELKFLLNVKQGRHVRDWAKSHMQPDPHAVGGCECGYWVNSLYLDTPAFDVLRRADGFRQRKYRLRRYGSESAIWLELKQKENRLVTKRRTKILDAELELKLHGSDQGTWDGAWFQNRLRKLHLQPVCQVTYQRFACLGNSSFGSTRLTIDTNLCCAAAQDWSVPLEPLVSNSLLGQSQILELKFRQTLPTGFRQLIEELELKPATFSKYRQSVEACIPISQLAGDA
jgi:hypothetical protein